MPLMLLLFLFCADFECNVTCALLSLALFMALHIKRSHWVNTTESLFLYKNSHYLKTINNVTHVQWSYIFDRKEREQQKELHERRKQ
jgi:hypothetical protein